MGETLLVSASVAGSAILTEHFSVNFPANSRSVAEGGELGFQASETVLMGFSL